MPELVDFELTIIGPPDGHTIDEGLIRPGSDVVIQPLAGTPRPFVLWGWEISRAKVAP